MPGLSFLNKKSWHTTNVKNVERVWLAEKKAEEEQKRLAELQKQLQEERQILELRQLQAAHGQVTKTIDNSLDWMYEGPVSSNQKQQSSEEYLLGKIYNGAADHSKVAAVIPDPKAPAKWLNKVASKNDSFSRAHEDPFIMIKQEENRRREKLVNNPIKMDKIKQKIALELKEKEDKKSAKKAAKREKKEQKKNAKRRKKESVREGQSAEKDGNSSSSDSAGSGSESDGHHREDRRRREPTAYEVKHEPSREKKEDRPLRSRSRSGSPVRKEAESISKKDHHDKPHREYRRDSRDRGTDRVRDRQNSRDRLNATRGNSRDRNDRAERSGGYRGADDRRRDNDFHEREAGRDRDYGSRRHKEASYNRYNRDNNRYNDRDGRDRRDNRDDRPSHRRSNSRQRDHRNSDAHSDRRNDSTRPSYSNSTSNSTSQPMHSRKRDRSPSPAPAPAADRTVTKRHTAHSDSENSESSQSKPKQRYGLLPNKNRPTDATSNTSDPSNSSSSSSHASSLGPNPALLQKKIDAEKATEAARKNRAREDVRKLTEEERLQRIQAMQEDAQKNDAVRAVRHDPERKIAEVDENTGNAAFLDSMRKTVYTTSELDMQSRLDQNKYSRQSAADIDSAEGFLRK